MNQSEWQVDMAAERFDELLEAALKGEPQFIIKDKQRVAVVLRYSEALSLNKRKVKLSEFFRNSPLVGSDIDLDRKRT